MGMDAGIIKKNKQLIKLKKSSDSPGVIVRLVL